MTLSVPGQPTFSIGTSSTSTPATAGTAGVDMSLDDMIKNRRKTLRKNPRRTTGARKPTAADKAAGRQRATRAAAVNSRRGIQSSNKPSAMEIEREVYRQTRMNTPQKKTFQKGARRTRETVAAQGKARRQKKQQQQQQQQKKGGKQENPPVWVGGAKRPPSKKAISAAVNAMSDAGFKPPKGMQMVISFAPAPDNKPQQNKGKQQQSNKQGNKQNKGKGGGRKK